MDREKFNYALNRDSFLTGMGWKMLHFAFDDIQRRPDVCRMLLQLSVGPLLIGSPHLQIKNERIGSILLSPFQKEVLKFAWRLGRPIKPRDVMQQYNLSFRPARELLLGLVDRSLLTPRTNGKQIRGYETLGKFPFHLLE